MAWPNTEGWIISLVATHTSWSRSRARQEAPQRVLPLGQVAQAVLDNDHRAIHDEAKVEGAQAHQVAADPRPHHADGRHQHGQRDGQGRNQRRPQVAQEEKQHGNHQEGAFGQVFLARS